LHTSNGFIDRKYRLVRALGSGAAGEVWEAENVLIGRRVAIKLLHPAHAASDIHARFLAEARAAARIAHPNIVDVFDLGDAGGTPYIVMELLFGETLEGIISRGAVAASFACELVIQILAALEAAHAIGIVHRDLKPSNVMVLHPKPDESVVKVLDFGIAKGLMTEDTSPDETGSIFGTPEYMAPEQALGVPVDSRIDLYATGAILYELLTGVPPFTGTNASMVLAGVLTQNPKPPREHVSTIPPGLEATVLSALAKDPDDRPQTARAMYEELVHYCLTTPSSIPAPRVSERPIPLIAKGAKKKLELILTPPPPAPDFEDDE
jgi:serine/threonine protein kinase